MDALALLCTLHADGPTTLRRLRDAGCGSIEDLGIVRAERLAELLGVSPAAARRFMREAAGLADRLGRQDLEPEEDSAPLSAAAPAAGPDHGVLSPAPPGSGRGLDRTDRRVLERVIERWRAEEERDAEARADASESFAPLGADPRISPSERPDLEAQGEPLTPIANGDLGEHGDLGTQGRPLLPGVLDGLDAERCACLRAAGCTTLEELCEAGALELARRADLPFTLVRRLQFMAGRSAKDALERPAAPLPAEDRKRAPSFAWAAHAEPQTAPEIEVNDGPAGPFA
jgi:hypothetical protein